MVSLLREEALKGISENFIEYSCVFDCRKEDVKSNREVWKKRGVK